MTATRFYEEVFDGQTTRPRAERVRVDDVELVLERVWDRGGTVIELLVTAFGSRITRATFRDPAGRLVEIAEAM